jgi:DNA-directed RNA polymerase subunit F
MAEKKTSQVDVKKIFFYVLQRLPPIMIIGAVIMILVNNFQVVAPDAFAALKKAQTYTSLFKDVDFKAGDVLNETWKSLGEGATYKDLFSAWMYWLLCGIVFAGQWFLLDFREAMRHTLKVQHLSTKYSVSVVADTDNTFVYTVDDIPVDQEMDAFRHLIVANSILAAYSGVFPKEYPSLEKSSILGGTDIVIVDSRSNNPVLKSTFEVIYQAGSPDRMVEELRETGVLLESDIEKILKFLPLTEDTLRDLVPTVRLNFAQETLRLILETSSGARQSDTPRQLRNLAIRNLDNTCIRAIAELQPATIEHLEAILRDAAYQKVLNIIQYNVGKKVVKGTISCSIPKKYSKPFVRACEKSLIKFLTGGGYSR